MNEERVRASLRGLDRFEAPPLRASVVTRVRRRRVSRIVGAAGAALVLVAGAVFAYASVSRGGVEDQLLPAGPTPSCSDEVWSCGPEADWIRSVAVETGWTVTADTGNALEISNGDQVAGVWAVELGTGRGVDPGFRQWEPAADLPIAVGTHGAERDDARLFWSVHGMGVYLTNEGEGGVSGLAPDTVRNLIRASLDSPPEGTPEVAESYPLIYIDDEIRVFAPIEGSGIWGWCPTAARPPGEADLERLRDAVSAWAATSEERAFQEVEIADIQLGEVFNPERKRCGAEVADSTAVVGITYPRVTWSASIGQAMLYAVLQPRGWILWFNY